MKYHTNSHSVLLMTTSGHIIDSAGAFDHFKIGNMSALIAANFMATTELARLIGNQSAFKTCHNNGPDFDIFSFSLTGDFLLTVIFGKTSKVGLVRYYVNQYSKQLINLLVDSEIVFDLSDSHLVSVEDEINQLFGSPNGF
ncbi:MAG: hypothetical protein AAF633_17235 [Chloroflexota bacterium]